MDGVHDMGGMHGFGSIPIEDDRPFHEPWEVRVSAMAGAVVGRTTIDQFRYTIEQMPPAEYLASSYYARWLWAMERLLDRSGASPALPRPKPDTALWAGRFRAGDDVRVINRVTAAHTRVPRYLRGHVGRVERSAFAWPNPTESAATGAYGPPELVYTVSFAASDLFGPDADHTLTADLGESDLEAP